MSIEKLDFATIKHSQKSYTLFFNDVIQNIPSASVLGVWVYLSSLPPDWIVYKTHLMSHFKMGRDNLNKILCWLHQNKLLDYEQARDEKGMITKWSIVIKDGMDFINHIKNESTTLKSSKVDVPTVEKNKNVDNSLSTTLKIQSMENPLTGETATTNTTFNTNTTKNKNASLFVQKQNNPVAWRAESTNKQSEFSQGIKERFGRTSVTEEYLTAEKGNPDVAKQYLSSLPIHLRPKRYKDDEEIKVAS